MKLKEKNKNNKIKTVALKEFNAVEMNLLFAIFYKMKNKSLDKITFEFWEIKELSNYKEKFNSRFIDRIENIFSKISQLKNKTPSTLKPLIFFTEYVIDTENETITFKINKDIKNHPHEIFGKFTKIELEEFTDFRSSYSKTAYRLLKQFGRSGYLILQIDEFKRLFDVPESYKISDIDKNILNKIEDELPKYFKNLEINKLKGRGKRKRYIEYIEFKFELELKDETNRNEEFYLLNLNNKKLIYKTLDGLFGNLEYNLKRKRMLLEDLEKKNFDPEETNNFISENNVLNFDFDIKKISGKEFEELKDHSKVMFFKE